MAGRGFIHDKLEIKFLILYIVARVIEPIPFDTVLDLTLCDDAIDYFDFSDCLADLVRTEHMTLKDELYDIIQTYIDDMSLNFSFNYCCIKASFFIDLFAFTTDLIRCDIY